MFVSSISGLKGWYFIGNSRNNDEIDICGGINDEKGYQILIPTLSTASSLSLDKDTIDRFVCKCGKTYKEERYMRFHQRWECGKLPAFPCPFCHYCTHRRNSLKQHKNRRHRGVIMKLRNQTDDIDTNIQNE